ncbi:MAG: putative quinol monooxygenase [Fimbriiglobus sp.]
MIHVIATIELAAGKRAEWLTHFRWVTPLVRAEAGCVEYAAAADVATGLPVQPPLRPDVVTVVEKWSDVPALQVHLAAPHMAEYRVRVAGLVTKVTLHVLEPVE